eukprot:COSAG01_NODE_62986_length_282_cov_0.502732_1_plen_71_part_10
MCITVLHTICVWQALNPHTHAVRLGKSARLEIRGVDVVVASERAQTLDVASFQLHGIEVSRYKLVGLKCEF